MLNKANNKEESGHESLWWHLAEVVSFSTEKNGNANDDDERKKPLSFSNARQEFIMRVKVLQRMECIESVCVCADERRLEKGLMTENALAILWKFLLFM